MMHSHGVHCDSCSNSEESCGRSFREMIAEIKTLGWKIFKIGEIWCHKCPVCIETEKAVSVKPEHWWQK